MDALILAAGFGTRLRAISESKPLAPIRGVPLIELAIRQAALAGVDRAVVVTGYRADFVEAALPSISRIAGIEVIAQRLGNYALSNGHSVMAGASRISGDYLLMMADHIISLSILRRLMNEGRGTRGVTLAIDRRVDSPLIDPDDATWVDVDHRNHICAIGKGIARYNAVDCGAFLATPELQRAIAAAIDAGHSGSLSDGMQYLADRGRAATMDIGDAWWLDVDDPLAHAQAEAGVVAHLPEIFTAGASIPGSEVTDRLHVRRSPIKVGVAR